MKGERDNLSYRRLIQTPLKLLLDMAHSSSADNVTTRVAWMFSWRIKMRVKPSLILDPPGISKAGSDLKIA